MSESPKSIEEKLTHIIDAWTAHAPNATFAKMTLEKFIEAVKPSLDKRKQIKDLDEEIAAAINDRDTFDVKSLATAEKVVKAVVGDVDFGDDSILYEAMGYVRSSERQSGLTRKKSAAAKKAGEAGK